MWRSNCIKLWKPGLRRQTDWNLSAQTHKLCDLRLVSSSAPLSLNFPIYEPIQHVISRYRIPICWVPAKSWAYRNASVIVKLTNPGRGLAWKKIIYNRGYFRDLPGGPGVKNLTANAGDMGSIPGLGTKIPHAERQLSPCAPTTEPTCSRAFLTQLLNFTKLEPILCKKRSHCSEKPAHCN